MKRFFAVFMTALALASLLVAGGFGASTQRAQAARGRSTPTQPMPPCAETEARIFNPLGVACQSFGVKEWTGLSRVCAGSRPVDVIDLESREALLVQPETCSSVDTGPTQVIVY